MIELAKQLNRGVSAIGLTMATYEEAAQSGEVRKTAKNLLIRMLCAEFPNGFFEDEIGAHIRLGSWRYDIKRNVHDPYIHDCACNIMKHLTIDHPPPTGWKPEPHNDPLIDELFNQYWPIKQDVSINEVAR